MTSTLWRRYGCQLTNARLCVNSVRNLLHIWQFHGSVITTQVFLRVELKSFPHFRVNKLRVFAEPACTLFCLTVYRHMDTCRNECYSASLDLSAGHPREDFFFFSHIYLLVAVKTKIPKISSPPLQAAFGRPLPPPPQILGRCWSNIPIFIQYTVMSCLDNVSAWFNLDIQFNSAYYKSTNQLLFVKL